jgi:hypothetical protein
MTPTDHDRLIWGLPPEDFDCLPLRDQFLALVESKRLGLTPDERDRMRKLSGELWFSTDALPRQARDELKLPPGSTYGGAAHALVSRG